jgi:hypothetical protein
LTIAGGLQSESSSFEEEDSAEESTSDLSEFGDLDPPFRPRRSRFPPVYQISSSSSSDNVIELDRANHPRAACEQPPARPPSPTQAHPRSALPAEQIAAIRAALANRDVLRRIIAGLPGVDADDSQFDQFAAPEPRPLAKAAPL